MKILILGAGAMGCLYGAALHRAGAEVAFVDVNQPHIDAINQRGLELETRAGTEYLPIPALRPEDVREPADLIVVFTKTFHTDGALAGIAAGIGPETWLLSLQNGLGNDARLAAHADESRVLVGASTLPSDLVGPGRVRSHGEGGSKLYPAFGGDPAFAGRVAQLLTDGGLPAALDPEIHSAIWSKAIFNAAMNPLCALTLRTPGFLGAHEESRSMIHAVVEEGVATARASGVNIESKPIHDLTQISMTDHANHEASMLQDVKAHRRTEIDAINGAIVAAARKAGVPVPVTQTLCNLVRLEDAKLTES
ncbi:2-dehydropantoate 2-reductase [Altererythrobacter atlanticus]|uniref:2-dehydropantoate 2-reductase n=1 Tax=Croceibacterium atlanticum TaxID=1267766 RepID=A0A0F7KSS0_9SPHN|nr:2-dehydropantoate 2-reductase [Croceibacterium atlanticum]AKH42186.1 2-dehydropantoate 2-reductase [Croceibacterium atlanticum]MBB5734002.1 2-dehydropantoate 2-reductase [Croceibacterium atlanticum]